MIPVGNAPVGLVVSPDGRWLYATSELAAGASSSGQGTLTVIDLRRAETDPAASPTNMAVSTSRSSSSACDQS